MPQEMTAGDLVTKMAKAKWNANVGDGSKTWDELDKDYQEIWLDDMRIVLRIVLKAIEDGDVAVVSGDGIMIGKSLFVGLKPSFKAFMEAK